MALLGLPDFPKDEKIAGWQNEVLYLCGQLISRLGEWAKPLDSALTTIHGKDALKMIAVSAEIDKTVAAFKDSIIAFRDKVKPV